jgi:uncharacterized protein (TIGR02246 family)
MKKLSIVTSLAVLTALGVAPMPASSVLSGSAASFGLVGSALADDAPSNPASIEYDRTNEAAIRKLYNEFQAAWNRHDVKALGDMYALDGDHREPDGTMYKGRDEILALLKKQHASFFKDTTLALDIEDVWFITAQVALVDGAYTLSGAKLPDGTALPARKGHLTAIFLKERGRWWIEASRLMVPVSLPYKHKQG